MRQATRLGASISGSGIITYGRPGLFGGTTLLRGEGFTGYYRPHLHTTHVIGVVERGELGLTIGEVPYRLGPGSILLLNPFQVHQEYSLGGSGWSFRYFYPEGPGLERILGGFAEPVLRHEAVARALVRLHESLLAGAESSLGGAEAAFADAVRRLMKQGRSAARSGESAPVRRVRSYLHEAPADALSLDGLARLAGVSAFHLVRRFHREVGLPPHSYYEQLRIARCKALLHDRRRLSEVAYLMRYSDQSHFTRQFGNAAGVSPGKYAAMVDAPGHRLALPVRARRFNTLVTPSGEDAMHG